MTPLAVYQMTIDVLDQDIDIMGHVNNVAYIGWMQDAAVAHSDINGWSWGRYQKLGAGFVARSHQIEYRSPAFRGDRILVDTWVTEMKRVSSSRSYQFVNEKDGKLLATASTRWAFVRLNDGGPIRIPGEITEAFLVVQRDFDRSTN